MRRSTFAYVIVAALSAGLLLVLWAQQRSGPPRTDLLVEGSIPATLYMPERVDNPPVVVVGHGLSGDRLTMSSLSRRIAESGYALLAIDFSGHGSNASSGTDPAVDFSNAIDGLAAITEVDDERVAILGHSMGAYAATESASRDSGVNAVVALSGGGSEPIGRVPNVLFLAGERETSLMQDAIAAASVIVGSEVDVGSTYGDTKDGTAVRVAEVRGANHLTILWSAETVAATVSWLDQV